MRICLVQSYSQPGKISENIENHLRLIEQGIQSKADLIVFPELSITGYEPSLAKELACDVNDDQFNIFQQLADTHQITIGIGAPTKAIDGINISIIFFQPHRERALYAKQILHADELLYFTKGERKPFILHMEKQIAFGICYETLQRAHLVSAVAYQAAIYIASVAKPAKGIEKAQRYFPSVAQEFNIPILMANSVGQCDNFLSIGNSSVWNEKGEVLAQLNDEHQGLLIYDTDLNKATISYHN